MVLHARIEDVAVQAPVRSERSLAFEAFWRALPKDGLVPLRSAFRPERATAFLPDILLLEAKFGETPVLRVRLAGSALERRVQQSMTGEDYMEYFEESHRPRAAANAEAVVCHPCGRWALAPVHYERGYAQYIEATMFPLYMDNGGAPLVLMLTHVVGNPILPLSTSGKAMHAHAPASYDFIDIGAGVPPKNLFPLK